MSEQEDQRGSDFVEPGPSGAGRPVPSPDGPTSSLAGRRKDRIRHLKELVREADYDVPSDEVAARIIRDALFGAPEPDEPS